MSVAEATIFRETPLLFHRQKEVLDSLKRGEISDVRVSHSYAADKIVSFGLKEGFLQEGLKRFPDPRRHVEVPVEVLLLPQILQRLHDEHSLLLAPYIEDFTVKTLRQRRPQEPNSKIIIYAKHFFGTILFLDLLSMLTKLSQRVLKKLSVFFDALKTQTYFNTS